MGFSPGQFRALRPLLDVQYTNQAAPGPPGGQDEGGDSFLPGYPSLLLFFIPKGLLSLTWKVTP